MNMGCDYFIELRKGYNKEKEKREGGYGIDDKREWRYVVLFRNVMNNAC